MHSVLPEWVQNASIQPSPDPPLRPAIRQDGILQPAFHHDHRLGETNIAATVAASSDSPVPDHTIRWMKTRSRSRPPNAEEGSTVEDNTAMSPQAISEAVKRKRVTSNSQTEEPKKSKSTKRPKPQRKVGARAGMNTDMDTFDMRHRHAA